jgi:hypothetical protein
VLATDSPRERLPRANLALLIRRRRGSYPCEARGLERWPLRRNERSVTTHALDALDLRILSDIEDDSTVARGGGAVIIWLGHSGCYED